MDERISDRANRLIKADFEERDQELLKKISLMNEEMNAKGSSHSGARIQKIVDIIREEYQARISNAWSHILRAYKTIGTPLTSNLNKEFKSLINEHIHSSGQTLSEVARRELGTANYQQWNNNYYKLENSLTEKIHVEIDLYVDELFRSGVIQPNDKKMAKNKKAEPQKVSEVKSPQKSEGTAARAEFIPQYVSISRSSVSDQPTSKDALGFEPYVNAVAEFLTSEDTKPPLTLSVEGEWGSGKSSFMIQLMQKIRDKGGLTVWFSPWRHDQGESVWAAFALELTRQLSREHRFIIATWMNIKLFWHRFDWREGWTEVFKVGAIWSTYLLVLFAIIFTLWVGDLPYPKHWVVKTLITSAGSLIVFVGILQKLKNIIGNPLKYDLKRFIQKPDYIDKICFIEQFHKDFKKIIETYIGDQRVYVFIDDLDRCEIPKAAELIQAINLMIADDPKLVFILGMDRDKIAAGFAVKHEKLIPYLFPQKTIPHGSIWLDYGYSFLEKFIQVPFRLPRPTNAEIGKMIADIQRFPIEKEQSDSAVPPIVNEDSTPTIQRGTKDGIKDVEAKLLIQRRETIRLKLTGDSPEINQIVIMVAPTLGFNPRRIKQFINLFRLRAYISNETGLFDIVEGKTRFDSLTLEQLGKFVAISMTWPALLRDIEKETDLLRVLSTSSDNDIQNVSKSAQQWFKDKKLMTLVHYATSTVNQEDLEWPKYNLLYVNIKKLLEISPAIENKPKGK